jgi:hypothetical protein
MHFTIIEEARKVPTLGPTTLQPSGAAGMCAAAVSGTSCTSLSLIIVHDRQNGL